MAHFDEAVASSKFDAFLARRFVLRPVADGRFTSAPSWIYCDQTASEMNEKRISNGRTGMAQAKLAGRRR